MHEFLNKTFFESALSSVVITLQSDPKANALGWFTRWKAWQAGEERSHEINISANFLDRLPIEKAETMLHEMCHQFAAENNKKDCSRGGTYHNKVYKEIGESHGLEVSKSTKGGFNVTALTENSKELITPYLNGFELLKRIEPLKLSGTTTSSTRKYICPTCGMTVRATKKVNIICGDCEETLRCDDDD